MTVDDFKADLEKVVSDLSFSGFGKIDPAMVEKLDKLAVQADGLGLKGGKQLLQNLSGIMTAIKEGKSQAPSGILRLTALDFYVKRLPNEDNIEDLLIFE